MRSGCFCNPGVREIALGFVREDLANSFRKKERMTFEQFLHVIDNQKQGAVRVSMGPATNFADVYQFVQFVRTFIDRHGPLAEKTIQPRRAWALSLGRSIVRLGQRVERFGLSGHGSHRHLLHSSK